MHSGESVRHEGWQGKQTTRTQLSVSAQAARARLSTTTWFYPYKLLYSAIK